MEENIELIEKDGYLQCHVQGEENLEFSIKYNTAAAEKCRELGLNKVLVLEELEGILTTLETFTLCEDLPRIYSGLSLAFVDLRPEHYPANDFGVIVLTNRGCIAKQFSTKAKALEWLLSF